MRRVVRRFSVPQLRADLDDGRVTADDLPAILNQAVFMKHFKVVDALIAGGFVNVDDRAGNGATPLEVAIETLDKETVAYLLAKGAQVNAAGPNGWTPLHAAIDAEVEAALYEQDMGKPTAAPVPTISSMLAEHGANRGAKNSWGETPLAMARKRGHLAAALLLQETRQA